MPRFFRGLRARFLLATVALAIVLLSGFAYAIDRFLEIAEAQSINVSLVRHMDWFESAFRLDPRARPPEGLGLQAFVVPAGDQISAPSSLHGLPADTPREIKFGKDRMEVAAVRRDIGETRLYLTLSIESIESLEAHLAVVAWSLAAGALILAVMIGFWLASIVIRPVRRLASHVSAIQPGQPRPDLGSNNGDAHIQQIATSFEAVLDRFDAFAARERHFTEDASHELRTPVTVIMNAAELVHEDPGLSTQSRKRTRRILTASRQMRDMIELLLYLAREDGGGRNHRCDVAPVLEELVVTLRQQSSGPSQPIHLNIRGRPCVAAPAGAIASVASNLINNAADHAPSNRGITIELTDSEMLVRDYGEGLAAIASDRAFERNFSTRNTAGRGLGLNICARICERFGWHIAYQPGESGGAVFRVRFSPPGALRSSDGASS